MTKTQKQLGRWALAGILLPIPGALWYAHAVMTLWAWFVVPRFGLAPLSLSATVGLSTLAVLLIRSKPPREWGEDTSLLSETERIKRIRNMVSWMFWFPASALLIGAIARNF